MGETSGYGFHSEEGEVEADHTRIRPSPHSSQMERSAHKS